MPTTVKNLLNTWTLAGFIFCLALGLAAWRWPMFNIPSLMLVALGTPIAAALSFSPRLVWRILCAAPTEFRQLPALNFPDRTLFLYVADLHRRGKLRNAEDAADRLAEPLLAEGTRMIMDGKRGDEVAVRLNWLIDQGLQRDLQPVQVVRSMAATAPALGLLGTLIGLVMMLGKIDAAGLTDIGNAMSFALMSTVYGVFVSHFICKPLAVKFETKAMALQSWRQFQADLIAMLFERQHPDDIAYRIDALTQDATEHSWQLAPQPVAAMIGSTS